jgi:hypothetical protein
MGFITTPVSYFRLNAIPLDTTEVYTTYEQLTSYAQTSDKVYYGQICSVVDDGVYIINSNRTVTKLGTSTVTTTSNITTSDYDYLTEYYGSSAVYLGSAPKSSLTTSPVWTIKKTIYSPSGSFISSVSAVNIAWSNRYTI